MSIGTGDVVSHTNSHPTRIRIREVYKARTALPSGLPAPEEAEPLGRRILREAEHDVRTEAIRLEEHVDRGALARGAQLVERVGRPAVLRAPPGPDEPRRPPRGSGQGQP